MYVNALASSGVVLNLTEYKDLAAINRDDIVLWNQAEAQRQHDEIELANKGAGRE